MLYRLFVLIFFLNPLPGHGQTIHHLNYFCLQQLGARANSHTLRTYAVRIDDLAGAVVVLKQEDHRTRGVLFFPNSREALRLYGDDRELYLRDSLGFDFGKLTYTCDKERFEGEWFAPSRGQMVSIRGVFTRDVPVVPPSCAEGKRLWTLKGRAGKDPVYMTLSRIGRDEVYGSLYLSRARQILLLTGVIRSETLDAVLTTADGKRVGDIAAHFIADSRLTGTYHGADDRGHPLEAVVLFSDSMTCRAEVTPSHRCGIVFPVSGRDRFDQLMQARAAAWFHRAVARGPGAGHTVFESAPSYSYVQVLARDKRYFSGLQISFLAGTGRYDVAAFNYDLRKDRFLEASDLFTDTVAVQILAKKKALARLNDYHLQMQDEYKRFIAGITHFEPLVTPAGILFCGGYDPVFGAFYVQVGFDELRPYMNNKRLIRHFRKTYR